MKWAFGLIPKRDKAGRWKQSVPPSSVVSPLATISLDQFVLFLIEALVCSNSIIQQKILF